MSFSVKCQKSDIKNIKINIQIERVTALIIKIVKLIKISILAKN